MLETDELKEALASDGGQHEEAVRSNVPAGIGRRRMLGSAGFWRRR